MSNLVLTSLGSIDIKDVIGEKIHGHFSYLDCEKHGGQLCLTDATGSDWCLKCVELMIKTGGEIQPYGNKIIV